MAAGPPRSLLTEPPSLPLRLASLLKAGKASGPKGKPVKNPSCSRNKVQHQRLLPGLKVPVSTSSFASAESQTLENALSVDGFVKQLETAENDRNEYVVHFSLYVSIFHSIISLLQV